MQHNDLRPMSSGEGQGKDNLRTTQLKTIFAFFRSHIATASMAAAATGVPQKCICRYKRDLEKNGLLWEVERKICQKTGFRAWYLTTDPAKAPMGNRQLNLFS